MQQPMETYVGGINLSSESVLIRSYLLFEPETSSCQILVQHLFYVKSKSDKTRELSDLKFIPQT